MISLGLGSCAGGIVMEDLAWLPACQRVGTLPRVREGCMARSLTLDYGLRWDGDVVCQLKGRVKLNDDTLLLQQAWIVLACSVLMAWHGLVALSKAMSRELTTCLAVKKEGYIWAVRSTNSEFAVELDYNSFHVCDRCKRGRTAFGAGLMTATGCTGDPDLAFDAGRLDTAAYCIPKWTHSHGRTVDSQGSGCGGEG